MGAPVPSVAVFYHAAKLNVLKRYNKIILNLDVHI